MSLSSTQILPTRTSLHTNLQQTTYHYNSILHAKSQVDSYVVKRANFFSTLNNKRQKQQNKKRITQNKKMLNALISIDKDYCLYDYFKTQHNQNQHNTNHQINKHNKSVQLDHFINRKLSFQQKFKRRSIQQERSLKNQFLQKQKRLSISYQNSKLYNKITSSQSIIANPKDLKIWNKNMDKYNQILNIRRVKKLQSINKSKQFFQTFNRAKVTNLYSTFKSHQKSQKDNQFTTTIKLDSLSVILTPQIQQNCMNIHRILNYQKSQRFDSQFRQQQRIKTQANDGYKLKLRFKRNQRKLKIKNKKLSIKANLPLQQEKVHLHSQTYQNQQANPQNQ